MTGAALLPTTADYAKARNAALRILEDMGIEEPPVNPVTIARNLGVDVRFISFEGESKNVSGFYDCEDNVIMVNRQEFSLRQTFTVAHELGHKILHEEWARSDSYRVLLRDPSLREADPIEQEANFFAANLLMPRHMMDRYFQLPLPQISSIFAVSAPAVQARLQSLYGI